MVLIRLWLCPATIRAQTPSPLLEPQERAALERRADAVLRAADPDSVAKPALDLQDDRALLKDVLRRLEAVEAKLAANAANTADSSLEVALEEVELDGLDFAAGSHVLARPWSENLRWSGHLSLLAILTGAQARYPELQFAVDQLHLTLDADVWTDVSAHVEMILTRRGEDSLNRARLGEVYARFDELFGMPELSLKVGRFDLPFGDEYVRRKNPENPRITWSPAFPYSFDEGLLLIGDFERIDAFLAVTEGEGTFSADATSDKALTARVVGQPLEDLELSASFHRTGATRVSALNFSGMYIEPVNSGLISSAGTSGSSAVHGLAYDLGLLYRLAETWELRASFGQAFVDDPDARFDRDFLWFQAEVLWRWREDFRFFAHYGEIGTYDAHAGYTFNGGPYGDGRLDFGFDARRLQRVGLGLGYDLNPRTLLKLEVGIDRFSLIDASPLDDDSDDRWFTALELTLVF